MSVAFSSDNRQIVSGSRDGTIKLWNTLGECKVKTFCSFFCLSIMFVFSSTQLKIKVTPNGFRAFVSRQTLPRI